MAYEMDEDIERIATSKNGDGAEFYAYCTSENVCVGFAGADIDAGIWASREQVIELIAILSRIVYSKPAEQPEQVAANG